MLYFWILTVILFALPVGLVMLTWDRSQADAQGMRDPLADHRLRTLFSGHRPHKPGRETAL